MNFQWGFGGGSRIGKGYVGGARGGGRAPRARAKVGGHPQKFFFQNFFLIFPLNLSILNIFYGFLGCLPAQLRVGDPGTENSFIAFSDSPSLPESKSVIKKFLTGVALTRYTHGLPTPGLLM